jgi:RNA polymerase sigma-70 factor (ECF subfamily)
MRVDEDNELVARMLAGDREAFEAFGARYVQPVYRFALCRLANDRPLARDLAQTALCKALGKLESYRGEASLLTWLCACCHNEIRMHARRRRSAPAELELEERTEPELEGWRERLGSPEERLIRREGALAVHMTLDLLPGHYARALEHKYCDRLSVREISERMARSPKAVESLLTRARDAFRAAYRNLTAEPDLRPTTARPGGVRRELGHG